MSDTFPGDESSTSSNLTPPRGPSVWDRPHTRLALRDIDVEHYLEIAAGVAIAAAGLSRRSRSGALLAIAGGTLDRPRTDGLARCDHPAGEAPGLARVGEKRRRPRLEGVVPGERSPVVDLRRVRTEAVLRPAGHVG